ncbi:MAG: YcxB family protein [Lachnospiraceae bacterium]|nr:YcxB family protein [Lachnospiraceae bacterium]
MFRYSISEEDFLNMARWMLEKRRGKGAGSVLKLLLKTVVQMGAAVFLILFYGEQVQPWLKWTVGILSGLWAALSLFQYFFVNARAKMLLQQSKNDPGSADFWKEHRLTAEDDGLRVTFGEGRLELPYEELSEIAETETLRLILRGKSVFEFVPKKAIPGEGWAAFQETVREKKREGQQERLNSFKEPVLEGAAFVRKMKLSREELADKNVRMKRLSFTCSAGWPMSTVISVVFPLALAVYCAMGGAWAYFALCMATFILFNFRYLVIFLPAYYEMTRAQTPEPAEDGYLLALKDKTAWVFSDHQAYSYPMDKLKKTIRNEEGLFLYFEKQSMLYVPLELADAFLEAAGLKKSLRIRAAALSVPTVEKDETGPEEKE